MSRADILPFPRRYNADWLASLAAGLWIALAVAACIKAGVQGDRHSVFPLYVSGSNHWWNDSPLYAFYPDVDIYRYSPTFAVLFTPFTWLPNRLGGALWNLLSAAAMFGGLRVLVRDVLPRFRTPWFEHLFVGLCLVGALRGIWNGQSNSFVLAAVICSAAAISRQRWWLASACLAAAVYVKFWPIAAVMLLAACWPKQLIGRFTACAAALAVVPFLTKPWSTVVSQYHGWYQSMAVNRQQRWPGFRDAWTIWETCVGDVNGQTYTCLQLATAALACAWVLWQVNRAASQRFLLANVLGAWVCWQLLFGPGSEVPTFLIAAPACTWALLHAYEQRRLFPLAVAAWTVTSLFSMGSLARALQPVFPWAQALLPIGVALTIAWYVWESRLAYRDGMPAELETASDFKAAEAPVERYRMAA